MKERGITLIEVIFATTLLLALLAGLLSLVLYCSNLQETSRNISIALNEARAKIEEIKSTTFSQIVSDYNAKVFSLSSLPGPGVMRTEASYVSGSGNNLIDVRVVVCWKEKGRVIGEDSNLNGVLDAGEDSNGNGRLDSPVELSTSIANR
ncbi:MAG: hypothetical protein DRP75_04445 [Candidatus Omnitrophota bacterium]|nr:MAG: hypothetical protein DRP75_04445 [Candidatus Omnitrophota bacterium]